MIAQCRLPERRRAWKFQLECLCRCLGCRFGQPGPANFGTPKHPRQVHIWRGICTSRSTLHTYNTLSAHTAVAQLKRSLPAEMLQDPGLGQPEDRGKDGKKKVFMSAMPPCLLRWQAHPPRSASRRIVRYREKRASFRDGTDFVWGSSAVAELSLGVLSLVLGTSVGRPKCTLLVVWLTVRTGREITLVGLVSQWGPWTLLRLLGSKRSLRRWKHRKPRRSPAKNFSITGIEETSDVLFDRDTPTTRR
jgi:hypothetical protein